MRFFPFAFKIGVFILWPMSALSITSVGLGVALAVVALAVWGERRPYQPGRPWGIPWRAMMALALLAMLVLAAHLISLLSGHPFGGRAGF
jgi:hypothetical protein